MSSIESTNSIPNHHTTDETNSRSPTPSTFSGRKLARSIGTIIPHMLKHIGLGSIKGLEYSACTVAELLQKKVANVGDDGSKTRKLCFAIATFAGTIVGAVAAVPGLLIGGAFGIARSIYKLPEAMKTSWDNGFCEALNLSNEFYHINTSKIKIIAATASVVLASLIIIVASSAGGPSLGFGIGVLATPILFANIYALNEAIKDFPKISTSDDSSS